MLVTFFKIKGKKFQSKMLRNLPISKPSKRETENLQKRKQETLVTLFRKIKSFKSRKTRNLPIQVADLKPKTIPTK
jgi:hypothetical protein